MLEKDVFFGFSNLKQITHPLEFGQGLVFQPTYAHLMAHHLLAFEPATPGKHHPAPWKPVSGGQSFDIVAELLIPESYQSGPFKLRAAIFIASLLRFRVSPSVALVAFSNCSFSKLKEADDSFAHHLPAETRLRLLEFDPQDDHVEGSIKWVRENWATALELSQKSIPFGLALEALDSIHYAHHPAHALVSLWGAIEGLFAQSNQEVRFRVSSNLAVFLEPPGESRWLAQRELARLYNERSAAAHGRSSSDLDALMKTYYYLRRAVIKILLKGSVPNLEELSRELFSPS